MADDATDAPGTGPAGDKPAMYPTGYETADRFCPRCGRVTRHWWYRGPMPGLRPWVLLPLWPIRAALTALLNLATTRGWCSVCG